MHNFNRVKSIPKIWVIFVNVIKLPKVNNDQGSMLWSQFSAIFANFRRKTVVFLQNQFYDQIYS
jgi:hypothetical protein